ncbi:MAG: T9SS type A sorting domain-containing protein [Cyclobacteriaceae bacterium]|jgi:hypothetical protein
MKIAFILIVIVAIVQPSLKSSAATLTSNGTGGGDWDVAASWDNTNTPDDMLAGDTLVIQLGDTITITGNEAFTGVLQIYGVLILDNARLNLGTGSVVQLAAGSDIIALNNGENEYISIGSQSNRISSSYINDILIKPNQLTEDNISSGGCAVTGDCDDDPLPVKVMYFRAIEQNVSIKLEWATSFEENFEYFTLERSSDGRIFNDFAKIYSNTILSSSTKRYEYIDEMPFPGLSYYRLKATDFDGSYEYHGVVNANLENMEPDILIYPNPNTHNQITVSFNGTQQSEYRILDLLGKVIENGILLPGLNEIIIPPSVSTSIYFLQVDGSDAAIVKKFVIR